MSLKYTARVQSRRIVHGQRHRDDIVTVPL